MNTDHEAQRRNWQGNILLTGGVMITILLALILAQLDALQARAALDLPGLPIINIQATAIAVGQIIPLNLDPDGPVPPAELVVPAPDDLNPRPEFITGVSEEGVIFTICGEVPEGWLLYTVQPGETLASLAAGTESAAANLAAANCLVDGQLTAGMQVLLPREPVASLCGPPQWWVRYQVQPGDTVGALASNRGTTVDEVLRANCRDSQDLLSGQLIFLPPGFQSGPAAPVPQPSLTPLPPPTDVPPTPAPLPTATNQPQQPPPPPPSPTAPIVASPVPPTATPPPLPTEPPPTLTPQPPPTEPPPLPTFTPQPPPTEEPPTSVPPTVTPPSPDSPATATAAPSTGGGG